MKPNDNEIDPKVLKKIMPTVAKTVTAAEEVISSYNGGKMFVHVQVFNIKGKDSNNYKIHQSQYWLRNEDVNVTQIGVTDESGKSLGSAYVRTDALLNFAKTAQIGKTRS